MRQRRGFWSLLGGEGEKKVKNTDPQILSEKEELNNWGGWRRPPFDFPRWPLDKIRNNYTTKKKIITPGRWLVARYELWWSLCQKHSIEYIISFLFHSEDFLLLMRESLLRCQSEWKGRASLIHASENNWKCSRTAHHLQHSQEVFSSFVHQAQTTVVETVGKLKQIIHLNVYYRGLPAERKWLAIKKETGRVGRRNSTLSIQDPYRIREEGTCNLEAS